jgi:hypothetical protein
MATMATMDPRSSPLLKLQVVSKWKSYLSF